MKLIEESYVNGKHLKDNQYLDLYMEDDLGIRLAACAIWYDEEVELSPKDAKKLSTQKVRIGTIGHYSSFDPEYGIAIINEACEILFACGCNYIIGPMDGSTWASYRLVTEPGDYPPFFLEPTNRNEWPDEFLKAGFKPIAEYTSALNSDLTRKNPKLVAAAERLRSNGITIRTVDPSQMNDELERIYEMSLTAFENNFLFMPVDEDYFTPQYQKIMKFIRPELVFLAEHNGELVGYLFGIPDMLQQKRKEEINTVIIKTVATLPGRLYAGLGQALIEQCHSAALELGYVKAIHALMYEGNNSKNISSYYAETIRRYTLYGKEL